MSPSPRSASPRRPGDGSRPCVRWRTWYPACPSGRCRCCSAWQFRSSPSPSGARNSAGPAIYCCASVPAARAAPRCRRAYRGGLALSARVARLRRVLASGPGLGRMDGMDRVPGGHPCLAAGPQPQHLATLPGARRQQLRAGSADHRAAARPARSDSKAFSCWWCWSWSPSPPDRSCKPASKNECARRRPAAYQWFPQTWRSPRRAPNGESATDRAGEGPTSIRISRRVADVLLAVLVLYFLLTGVTRLPEVGWALSGSSRSWCWCVCRPR